MQLHRGMANPLRPLNVVIGWQKEKLLTLI